MDGYTATWIVWLAAFALVEGKALFNKRLGDTLSENTRVWFKVDSSKKGRVAFASVWTVFGTWFLGHILNWWW